MSNPYNPGTAEYDAYARQVGAEGAAILDEIAAFIGRYVVFPAQEHCKTVLTLWVAHTHAAASFYVTPRIVLTSVEPGSAKTRVLEVLRHFVYRPKLTISSTAAALYRRLLDDVHTILFDEIDAIFGRNAGPASEDLRALLNSGYKRGATVDRCVGEGSKMVVQEFPVFAPAALAGLAGNIPATISTRSITIQMRKRAPGEHADPYRERDAEGEAEPIRKALADWVSERAVELGEARPVMPAGVVDRPAEVWEALLAVADAAGADWPKRGRDACRHFVLSANPSEVSLGVRLLGDLREIYGRADRLSTVDILERLNGLDESPWGDLYGKALDARRLAKELGRYGVAPVPFKEGDKTVKGYTTYPVDNKSAKSAGLADAWSRYLPPDSGNDGNSGNSAGQTGFRQIPVTAASVTGQDPETVLSREVTAVTAVTDNCEICGEPVDPAAGSVHPGCAQDARGSA